MSKDVFAVTVSSYESSHCEFFEAFEWSLSETISSGRIEGKRCFIGKYIVDRDIEASLEDIELVIREQLHEFIGKDTAVFVTKMQGGLK